MTSNTVCNAEDLWGDVAGGTTAGASRVVAMSDQKSKRFKHLGSVKFSIPGLNYHRVLSRNFKRIDGIESATLGVGFAGKSEAHASLATSLKVCFWWHVPKRSEGREPILGPQKYHAARAARGVPPDKETPEAALSVILREPRVPTITTISQNTQEHRCQQSFASNTLPHRREGYIYNGQRDVLISSVSKLPETPKWAYS